MKKFYSGACILCTVLGLSAQEVLWQKDIKTSTQDFLSQVTTTIDQQYLITVKTLLKDAANVLSQNGLTADIYSISNWQLAS